MIRRVIALAVTAGALVAPATAGAIVGGGAAADGTWPWAVQVVDLATSSSCAGALVAPAKVVTAAHCVSDGSPPVAKPVYVLAGDHRTLPGDGKYTASTKVTLAPGYAASAQDPHDLAVIELASDAPAPAAPVAVADSSQASEWAAGQNVLAAGWGLTSSDSGMPPSSLREVQMGVTTICGVSSDFFCAGDASHNTCQGDSGAPVIVQVGADTVAAGPTAANGTWRLAGIVAFGSSSCDQFTGVLQLASGANHDFVAPPPADPGGGGGNGGGDNPPPNDGGGGDQPPVAQPDQTGGTPITTPGPPAALALKLRSVKRSKQTLVLKLVAAERVSGLRLTLKKGKRTLAKLKVRSLFGSRRITIKVPRKSRLKKGRYVLTASGTVAGVVRTAALRVTVKK